MHRQPYEKLPIWRKAVALVESIYRLNKQLPSEERPALGMALSRAALGVPGKIADGCGRDSPKECISCFETALGGLRELHTNLCVAERLRFLTRMQTRLVRWRVRRLETLLFKMVDQLEADDARAQLKSDPASETPLAGAA